MTEILSRLKELLGTSSIVFGKSLSKDTSIQTGSKGGFYVHVTVAGGKTIESMRQVACFQIGDDGNLIEAELYLEGGQGGRCSGTARPNFTVESVLSSFVEDNKELSPAHLQIIGVLQTMRMDPW